MSSPYNMSAGKVSPKDKEDQELKSALGRLTLNVRPSGIETPSKFSAVAGGTDGKISKGQKEGGFVGEDEKGQFCKTDSPNWDSIPGPYAY